MPCFQHRRVRLQNHCLVFLTGERLYLVTICLSTKSAVTDWLTNYTQAILFVKRIWGLIPDDNSIPKHFILEQPAELYVFNE
jgi:hypothetical protein